MAAPTDATANGAHAGTGLRILVVDDSALTRQIIVSVVDAFGHGYSEAENGSEAVARVQGGGFDLVLMDMHMPVMNGMEAARAIRALPGPERAVPIIALSADAEDRHAAQYEAAGMNATVAKPLKPAALQAAIAKVVGGG